MHKLYDIPLADGRSLALGRIPVVMGILNVTPDSFSDGGAFNLVDTAVAHARQMIGDGADIIDIGGESTRPGAEPVSTQQELDRVIPVIEALIGAGVSTPLSIDSYKPLVADQAIQSGASIINDVHGLRRAPEMAEIAALHNAPVIAMHWDIERDQSKPIMGEIERYFTQTIAAAKAAGISREKLILDPGFGFGKSLSDNYAVLNATTMLTNLGFPLLIGTSRKSMIGKVLDTSTDERLSGTIATNVLAYSRGAHIFRVHDVRANRDALRVAAATLYGPPQETR
ncbi:dihydropteroate synthase [Devosia algicola]|uniref:Dihydropteroate synthase n=1 Tax=Devosia algicola TaxID=3026418 RepID=A0ABY7YPG9_9HYPH|nr:dihydropteroate synthase [Devosia algicola]WDR03191.1 dihydropteroate synthase [Devosia algicola]